MTKGTHRKHFYYSCVFFWYSGTSLTKLWFWQAIFWPWDTVSYSGHVIRNFCVWCTPTIVLCSSFSKEVHFRWWTEERQWCLLSSKCQMSLPLHLFYLLFFGALPHAVQNMKLIWLLVSNASWWLLWGALAYMYTVHIMMGLLSQVTWQQCARLQGWSPQVSQ